MLTNKLSNNLFKKAPITVACLFILSGCVSTTDKYQIPKPTLEANNDLTQINNAKLITEPETVNTSGLQTLTGLSVNGKQTQLADDEAYFSTKKQITAAAETMKLIDLMYAQ
jgi:hypothetical protein